MVYTAVSHRANSKNPNSVLARHNFIWADRTDPRYNNEYANNNNIGNPCQLEKYHLGFPFGPFGDMAVGQQFLDHAAVDILPACIIVPPVQTTFDESPTQWPVDRIIAAALLRWTTIKSSTATIKRQELNRAIRSYLEAPGSQRTTKLGVFASPRPTEAFGLDHEDCQWQESQRRVLSSNVHPSETDQG
jgi:hypothetical protein